LDGVHVRRWRLAIAGAVAATLIPGCASNQGHLPSCQHPADNLLVLEAQAVPTATLLPCVTALPIGWTFGGSLVQSGRARLWLDSDRAGIHAVEVDLTRSCDVSEGVEVPPAPGEVGVRVFQEPTSLPPSFAGVRSLVFPGGCITYRYRFAHGAPSTLVLEAVGALGTVPRTVMVRKVDDAVGLTLCGAGAPPCAG
jgi:hypothetical protein